MKDYATFKAQDSVIQRSEVRFEIDELLRELDDIENPHKISDTCIMLLNGLVMAVQFPIWKWNERADKTYGFKVAHMYYTATLFLGLSFFIQSRKDGGIHFLTNKKLGMLTMSRATVSLANVVQMIGLLYTGPEIAVALWFSKIFMVAIVEFLVKGHRPNRLIGSILISGILLTCLYVLYIHTSGEKLFGVILILISMFLYGFTVVFRSMLYHGYDDSQTKIPASSAGFWLCAMQIPLFSLYIIVDGFFLTKPLSFTDFIPCYNFGLKAWVLLVYLFGVFFIGKHVLTLGSHPYVITSYTGNYLGLLAIYLFYGFSQFNFSHVLIISLLYVNSMTCELAKVEKETLNKKDGLLKRYKTVMEKNKILVDKKKFMKDARKSRDMTLLMKDTLLQLQADSEIAQEIRDLHSAA